MRLVDADAMMKRLKAWDTNDAIDRALYNFALNRVLEAPTIEERKRGEWINVTNDESLEEEYECSVCGYELFYSNPTKFCPNCGADMRGEDHEFD